MSKKVWSYEAITQSVEQRIRMFASLAPDEDPIVVEMCQKWAYGAFCAWDHLTTGWQEVGDSERLEALVKELFEEQALKRSSET